ncbi:hypothetical protein Y1Q_0012677 [Alligator mississippiensis]|uniref:Uncharacterized protein n=1 Tax=Alligator mississippiensis TaxID=8496 RepID=A0A151M8J7_ALLMI|nr:hypothetical protein Y1Q_0012677 [Alligator mississippiensis]
MHRLHQQYMKDWTLLLQWLLVVLKEQEEWDRVQEQVQEMDFPSRAVCKMSSISVIGKSDFLSQEGGK